MKNCLFSKRGRVRKYSLCISARSVGMLAFAAYCSAAFAEDSTSVIPFAQGGESVSEQVAEQVAPEEVDSSVSETVVLPVVDSASLPSAPKVAESPAVKTETVPVQTVETVVVSAKKNPKKEAPKKPHRSVAKENALPVEERFSSPKSASGVEVYTQEDIQKMQPSDVYSIFERALGMTISRQGSRIHNWVQGRGGGNSNLGIVIDGVYIPATAAQRILGDIPVEMIESVRIVRDASILTMGPLMSPGSSNAGSANQGFIIIETKKPSKNENESTQATVGYGSYNSKKLVVFHGEEIGDIGSFGVGYAKKKNDSKEDRYGDWNNAYDANTYLVNGQLFDIGPISANGLVLYNQAKRDIQRYQESDGTFRTAAWTYDPMNTKVFTLGLTGKWTKNQITQLSGGYNDVYGMGYYDKIDSTGTKTYVAGSASRDKSMEANLYHTWIFKNASVTNSLKFGGQYVNWYQRTEGGTEEDARIEDMYGFYAVDEIQVNPSLSFDVGYRLDKRYIVQGGGKYTEDGKTVKLTDDTWANDGHSASLGSAYEFAKPYHMTARFSYTNSPTSDQLYTVNDKKLDAEERLKYELGATAELVDALGFSVTGYYYDIYNAKVQATNANGKGLTITAPDSTVITVYDSDDRLARYGMELSVFGRNIGPFGYQVGWSLFESSDSLDSEKLPGYKLTGDLSFAHKGFSANLNALRVPKYYSNKDMPVGKYFVFNVSLAQQLGNHFKVSVYGKNITNEKYAVNYKSGQGTETGYYYDVGALYGVDVSVAF